MNAGLLIVFHVKSASLYVKIKQTVPMLCQERLLQVDMLSVVKESPRESSHVQTGKYLVPRKGSVKSVTKVDLFLIIAL